MTIMIMIGNRELDIEKQNAENGDHYCLMAHLR